MTQTALEAAMALQIRAAKLPEPEREVRLVPGRQFRCDFGWRDKRIVLECNGGIWSGQGHARPTNIERDYEKANLLQLLGYVVLNCSPRAIRDGTALKWLELAFEARR